MHSTQLSIQGYNSPFALGDLRCDFKEAQKCTLQDLGRDARILEHIEVAKQLRLA